MVIDLNFIIYLLKKKPDRIHSIRECPFFILKIVYYPVSSEVTTSDQAGLLTFPPFWRPSHSYENSGTRWPKGFPFQTKHRNRRDYSGGPVPEFHGVPY